MINWVLLGEEAALEIETTVLAKAWMYDLACYYRECQVSVKPRVGERGCVVMEVVVQADWRTGWVLVTPREDFVSYPRSYFRILFRTSWKADLAV